jgi:CRISPR system Cascade subunit CasA
MNLLTDRWLPVRTSTGRRVIRPDQIAEPDVLALDFPRPDFNSAVAELLIGLLSTFDPPADERDWAARWRERRIDANALAVAAPAFAFERFAQEPGIDGTPLPIENLLIDALAGAEADASRDLMNRAGQIKALSPGMAAAALWALQSYAPQGGSEPNRDPNIKQTRVGYYTSLRRGGPLTTLVLAGSDLWGLVWPNVETREQLAARFVGRPDRDPTMALPWMRSNPAAITPDNTHPCTVYWATPRRIRLEISESRGETCSLTGGASETLVQSYVRAGGGPRYEGWQHPLSPHEKNAQAGGWVARRARMERVGMRNWLGYVLDAPDTRPAAVVRHALTHRHQLPLTRLTAYGYATDQKAVEGWQQSTMPLIMADPAIRNELDLCARQLVLSASEVARALEKAVRACKMPSRPPVAALWATLEGPFLAALRAVPGALETGSDDPTIAIREAWARRLRRTAYELFGQTCPLDHDPKSVTAARQKFAHDMRVACTKQLALAGGKNGRAE